MDKPKVILAYSGGLDTSAIIPWLRENRNCDVVAYCADLGNSPDQKLLEKKARKSGASDFIFENLQERFASEFVFPLVRASAIYEEEYLLGTAIARPLIAERVAYFAKKLNAKAVAHGGTGKGNDQFRFERSWAFLIPEIDIIAPWKEWEFKGRSDLIDYVKRYGISLDKKKNRFSIDSNLMHRSCEGAELEDVQSPYPHREVVQLTSLDNLKEKGKEAGKITLSFDDGLPSAINGIPLGPSNILASLNKIGLESGMGMGIVDLVENRINGMKSRGIYQTPGATLLHKALRCLKQICWDHSTYSTAITLGHIYGQRVYEGLWHSFDRFSLESFFKTASQNLKGEVCFKIQNNFFQVLWRKSEFSLYDKDDVSLEKDDDNINRSALALSQALRRISAKQGQVYSKLLNKKNEKP